MYTKMDMYLYCDWVRLTIRAQLPVVKKLEFRDPLLEHRLIGTMSISTASLNRAAIVTGAAQGIGRAIALRLARDGYDVAVNDLPSTTGGNDALNAVADEIRAQGRKAIAVTGDVSNEQDVQQIVDRTVKELGMLHVVRSHPLPSVLCPNKSTRWWPMLELDYPCRPSLIVCGFVSVSIVKPITSPFSSVGRLESLLDGELDRKLFVLQSGRKADAQTRTRRSYHW